MMLTNDQDGLFHTKDFETEDYDGDPCVDGYEINIFTKNVFEKDGAYSRPLWSVRKKIIDMNFLGERNPGDIGYILEETIKNSVCYKSVFDNDKRDVDMVVSKHIISKIYSLEMSCEFLYDGPYSYTSREILGLISQSERDKKIKIIIDDNE